MNQKEMVTSFLKTAAMGNTREAYERYVAPEFIHHNQYFKGDRQSLLEAMEQAHHKSPNASIEIKQIVEEGDRVVTHSLVRRKDPALPAIAVVHLFRIRDRKIVELWDVGQMLEPNSPNENGPF